MKEMWQTICRPNTKVIKSQICQTPTGNPRLEKMWCPTGTLQRRQCNGIDNITIQLLHRVVPDSGDTPETIEETLKQLETLWIDWLKCEFPQGLNWTRYDPPSRCHN